MEKLIDTLEFSCRACPQQVRATVKCSGPGIKRRIGRTLASVIIACPTCGQQNLLVFQPGGEVHSVYPKPTSRVLPEPSLN